MSTISASMETQLKKFGGTIISSKKIKDGHVIFLDPPDQKIVAVTEMQTPKTKKELRPLCRMISSLGDWFPSIQFDIKKLRAGCGEMKRFEWTKIMETEFKAVKHIFTHQIRLSPLDMDKKNEHCFGWSKLSRNWFHSVPECQRS